MRLSLPSEKVTWLTAPPTDTPAWIVAAANQYALDNGKTPFVIYQGRWNVMLRDFERDMCVSRPFLPPSSRSVLYRLLRGALADHLRDALLFALCSIPMCRQFGLALAPWDAIGSGRLITQKQLDERAASGEQLRRGGNDRSELEIKYSECLAEIAAEHGIESVTAVALACASLLLLLLIVRVR